MRSSLVIFLISIVGCAKTENFDPSLISFQFSKEAITSSDLIQEKTTNLLFNSNLDIQDELFSQSWISKIKTTKNFNNELIIEVEEHQPIAKLDRGRFLTQEGRIINPGNKVKQLNNEILVLQGKLKVVKLIQSKKLKIEEMDKENRIKSLNDSVDLSQNKIGENIGKGNS